MNIEAVTIDRTDVRKLLGAASADAALLYIFLKAGGEMAGAEKELNMNPGRVGCAAATLRQLGLCAMTSPAGSSPESVPATPSGMCWRQRIPIPPSGPCAARSSGCWAGT